jgi:RNA polymerase sigma-70 factor (ECF subfamily)
MSFFQPGSRRAPAALPDDADQRLLSRIAAADRHALAELYQGWHRRLYRFLARQTRRQDLIDEVINDTFLVVWQKAADFRGESRASTWIMGIAYRCMLKNLRQGGEQPVEATLEDFGLSAGPDEAHELHDWLNKGLSRLSAEQRDALELAYCLGHSLEEIAEITGCPVSTIKARMFHARIKLGNVLRTLGGERSTP